MREQDQARTGEEGKTDADPKASGSGRADHACPHQADRHYRTDNRGEWSRVGA
jgi:hypothetical protein